MSASWWNSGIMRSPVSAIFGSCIRFFPKSAPAQPHLQRLRATPSLPPSRWTRQTRQLYNAGTLTARRCGRPGRHGHLPAPLLVRISAGASTSRASLGLKRPSDDGFRVAAEVQEHPYHLPNGPVGKAAPGAGREQPADASPVCLYKTVAQGLADCGKFLRQLPQGLVTLGQERFPLRQGGLRLRQGHVLVGQGGLLLSEERIAVGQGLISLRYGGRPRFQFPLLFPYGCLCFFK